MNILDELVAKGVAGDVIVAVAKLIAEVGYLREHRERDAERKRNWRASVRGRPRMSQDVPGPENASLSIVKKEKKERGTRLAKEWQPDTDDCTYAVEHGLDPKTVARDFRDYWLARAGPNAVKMDWKLTWQRWCRTEQKQGKSKKPQWRSGIEGVI